MTKPKPAAMPDRTERTPRLAVPADLAAVRELVGAAYAKYADRMDRPPAPLFADYGAAIDAGQVWVLGAPIIALIVLADHDASLFIENVAVTPAAQGSGLGRLLMDFAEQQARARCLTQLELYTNEVMTENLAIYAHLGYREVDRRGDDGYRRVFMIKPLRPENRLAP